MSAAFGPARDLILPVAIRENVVVHIQDLPHDLTPKEADKIARVITAFAVRP